MVIVHSVASALLSMPAASTGTRLPSGRSRTAGRRWRRAAWRTRSNRSARREPTGWPRRPRCRRPPCPRTRVRSRRRPGGPRRRTRRPRPPRSAPPRPRRRRHRPSPRRRRRHCSLQAAAIRPSAVSQRQQSPERGRRRPHGGIPLFSAGPLRQPNDPPPYASGGRSSSRPEMNKRPLRPRGQTLDRASSPPRRRPGPGGDPWPGWPPAPPRLASVPTGYQQAKLWPGSSPATSGGSSSWHRSWA